MNEKIVSRFSELEGCFSDLVRAVLTKDYDTMLATSADLEYIAKKLNEAIARHIEGIE